MPVVVCAKYACIINIRGMISRVLLWHCYTDAKREYRLTGVLSMNRMCEKIIMTYISTVGHVHSFSGTIQLLFGHVWSSFAASIWLTPATRASSDANCVRSARSGKGCSTFARIMAAMAPEETEPCREVPRHA